MSADRKIIERLLDKITDLQRQIDEIHNELLLELDGDMLSAKEIEEVNAIRKNNDYRTFDEWDKEDD